MLFFYSRSREYFHLGDNACLQNERYHKDLLTWSLSRRSTRRFSTSCSTMGGFGSAAYSNATRNFKLFYTVRYFSTYD